MKLIVGLGNPGKEYEKTRHNVGFLVIDKIRNNENFTSWKFEKKFKSEISQGEILTQKIILAKPETFMNNSGEAVSLIANYFKIPIEEIIIIHDDLDLPLAKIRISQNSSSAGHNGVQSIINALGSQAFPRFRIGIAGEEKNLAEAEKYVLQNFNHSEQNEVESAVLLVIEAIEFSLSNGIIETMNEFN